MPIDSGRLLGGLTAAAVMVNQGSAGLGALEALIATAQEATGAAGATFTEYGDEGGRVVVASGGMAWTLGQPIGLEFLETDLAAQPWAATVDDMPAQVAEPLLVRGIRAIAGHPVKSPQRTVGSVHLYFADAPPDLLAQTAPVL